MDMMLERMNALIAGHGKVADKVTALLANSNTGHASSSTKRNRKKCTNCGKHIFHKPEDCYELKTNALAGMEIVQECQCASLTETGDVE